MQSGSVLKAECNATPWVRLSFPLLLLSPRWCLYSRRLPSLLRLHSPLACAGSSLTPDLSSHHLCEPHPAFLMPSALTMAACSLNSPHGSDTLFRGEDTGHMAGTRPSTSWALLTCGHFLGPPFRNPQVFSKCVSMTVAGYSKGPSMLSGVRSSYGSLSPSASPIAAQGRNRGNSNLCITPRGTTLALGKGMEVSLSVWIEWRL